MSGSPVRAAVDRAWHDAWQVDPEMSVSEWADARRELTGRSAAEPGRWRTDRFPFTREVMDSLSPESPWQRVVGMWARQLAKSEILLNVLGHSIECSPGPILIVQPSIDMAKKFSKQRVSPMIAATETLRLRVKPERQRDSGNTLLVKQFDDGILIMGGANSSASLRSMPARRLLADEVEEYDADVDSQGDALAIAEEVTANFPNRKVGIFGNPGIRGRSRTEKEYLRGDQRRYFIPCPHCRHMAVLTWQGRDWFGGKSGVNHRIAWDRDAAGKHRPKTAHMICAGNGCRVEEGEKTWMLEHGEWRATAAGDGITRSYQLSALYSPVGFRSWAAIAIEFYEVKGDPSRLRTWVNNKLGETWEERGEAASHDDLAARLERYDAEVPEGVGRLTAGVDVQGDRLIYSVVGWGAGEEAWLIEHGEWFGDPAREKGDESGKPSVWQELDALCAREFTHASGRKLKIDRICVDSGGHHTDRVYRYCGARVDRGVFATKGGREVNKPLVGMPSLHNVYRTPLFVLCVDTGKYAIVQRLRVATPGAGYIHLPDGVADEYLLQLTAEKAVYKWVNGASTRRWEEVYPRNHAFDCFVYALAGLYIMGQAAVRGLGDVAAKLGGPIEPAPVAPVERAPAVPMIRRPRPRGRWSGWRR